MDNNAKLNFVCYANSSWRDPLWTNRQHVMSRIAKKHGVLYLDLPLSFTRALRRKEGGRLEDFFNGAKKIQDDLFLYVPKIIPLDHYEIIHKYNVQLMRLQVRRLIDCLGFTDPVLWIYRPEQLEYTQGIPRKLLVYHCTDNYYQYMKMTGTGKHLDRYLHIENEAIKSADIIFTTAMGLYEKTKKINPSTFYAPNVADIDHFKKAGLEGTVVPEDIKRIKRPIIGFVGAVDQYKIDFKLIRYIAERNPEYSIVMIGPIGICDRSTSRDSLPDLPNIHYLGQRQYAVLPSYVKVFDVCIIPYNLNGYTENVFPLKLYEYMASGKPVVSTRLPSLPEYQDNVVYVTKSYEEFEKGILNALHENAHDQIRKRIEIAESNSWDNRVQQFLDTITMVSGKKKEQYDVTACKQTP